MSQESGAPNESGILTPSVPWDIAARTQRERILRAMAASCAEKTFAATTIADVVGKASISRATFYKHFANKEECFDAAAEGFVDELRGSVEEERGDAGDSAVEQVRQATATVLERLAAQPDQAKLLLLEAPSVDPGIVVRCRSLAVGALEARMKGEGGAEDNGADPKIAFGRAKILLADYVAAGKVESLPALLPELLYIALLPYAGQAAALEQAGAAS
jgi:AcrR family transcriptional regulator